MDSTVSRTLTAAALSGTLMLLVACVSPTNPHKDDEPNEDTGDPDQTGMIVPSEMAPNPGDGLPDLTASRPLA